MTGTSLKDLLRARAPDTMFALTMLKAGQGRYLPRWLRSVHDPHYLLNAPSPWLTFGAIDALTRYLRPGMRVFEFGSGGSTLFWLSRGAEVVAVEHDADWHALLRARIPAGSSIDYRLVPPEPAEAGTPSDPSDPAACVSDDPAYRGQTFRAYASQIDTFADGSFDLVLVDGRARPSCIAHGLPKVRPGGILVLDNADRPYYTARLTEALRPFIRRTYAGAGPCDRQLWRTDLYQGPQ